MDKDHLPASRETQVGLPGEVFAVKVKAEPGSMSKATHDHFGSSVFPPHPAHEVASRFRREPVDYGRVIAGLR
jgi:hypothetical protein